jgi:hypothetical protein
MPTRVPAGRGRVAAALVLTAAAFGLSAVKYAFEAYPRKVWRGEAAKPSVEVCPDGMDVQIELFAALLRGEERAGAALLQFLRSTYQSSTYLIGLTAAPLHLAGLPAPAAFCVVSGLASAALLLLLWRLLRDLFPRDPGWGLLVYATFLFHPSTVRCLVRPQSDALYALAAFGALVGGRFLARRAADPAPMGTNFVALAAAQTAALFVKIHAVVLPFVPAVVGFLHGLRARRLVLTALFGGVLPLLVWAALFQAFGLWVTIDNIWRLKVKFFANWDALRVVRLVLLTQGPLLAAAALHPRLLRELPLSLLLFVAGYSVLLWLTITPPILRYAFPAEAPLVVLAAGALHERFGGRPAARIWLATTLAWQATLLALFFGALAWLRYVGPVREIRALGSFVFDLS